MKQSYKNIKDDVSEEIQNIVFPIVGIGASAGGLEAISEFLEHLSPDTGMAFIFVQHLSPDHKSMLTPILSKITSMKVKEVRNKEQIKPNCFYIIPPDKEICVEDSHVIVSPRPSSPKFSLPIDILLTSLSNAHHEKAIGIILSGSATDGTIGLRIVKEQGGITFAQDHSAKFDSMPNSAISAGVVDFVLSPKEIALKLNNLIENPLIENLKLNITDEDFIDEGNADFKLILKKLNKASGVDFSVYKLKTIIRRILRRMLLHNLNDLSAYVALLDEKKEELTILYQDILINVTSFFRDPEIYTYLENELIPELIKSKSDEDTLRIWVPACSTGEEVFSFAMLFMEIQEKTNRHITIQLFATDLSERAITKARLGIYIENDLKSMTPKRIQRFFTKDDGTYRISKTIRDICVFATHNVLRDPPFSKIDLISCRNLFIYLDTAAQKRVLDTFHFALNETGILILGKAESISSSTKLYSEINKKFKIYSKKNGSEKITFPLPNFKSSKKELKDEKPTNPKKGATPYSKSKTNSKKLELSEAIDTILISDFLPPSVVINQHAEIVQFRGNTDLFFSHTAGKATLNIFKLVRKEIAFHLRILISKSLKTEERIKKEDIAVKINDKEFVISIEVAPLKIESDEQLMLVIFSQYEQSQVLNEIAGKDENQAKLLAIKEKKFKQLEMDLAASQEDAMSLAHEQERFIEELQSANEEVVSSNEELQTVNEELETSKEELESSNEELITTNQELQVRNELLIESYEYSNAIIATLHEPLVILDKNLKIKTTNKAFFSLFKLEKEDTEGKLLFELENKQWNIPSLRELLEHIIPKNTSFHNYKVTHEFPRIGEKVFLLNASKIIQKSHGDHLILLSFNDITEAMKVQKIELDMFTKNIEESRNYNLKLEEAVNERTKQLDLSNKSLAEKNNELGKMNKELEAFAYVSSHDLQEPLRKIQTFVERIMEKEKGNLSSNGKNYFRFIQKSANNMQLLIEELLNFTSLNSAERKFETLKLSDIIQDVKKEIKEDLEDSKTIIEMQEMCEAMVIPFQFRQLMINLISNSIKFTKPDTPVKITISSKVIERERIKTLEDLTSELYCHISVSDNGIGFDQEFEKRIFEVFEKLHSKDDYPGTGIGLAIVKKVVENHNGIISVKSEINKGTTFDIYIPAKNE